MIRQTGVNAGTDGIGGIHIRGGRNDQNLILYDGVPLYNSAHAFGIYSIINNSIVDQAKLYKSGVNGALFGRLSSIMDVRTKDPNLHAFHASAQVSTIASQATVEVPIVKNKIGLIIAGRRSHIDNYLKSKSRESKEKDNDFEYINSGETDYHFGDLHAKIYAKLSKKSRLFLTYYTGRDHYKDNETLDWLGLHDDREIQYKWSNTLSSIRFNHILTNNTFVNLQASYYNYKYYNAYESNFSDIEVPEYDRSKFDFNSGIKNYDLRINFESIKENMTFKYGINASFKDYRVGNLIIEEIQPDSTKPAPQNLALDTFPIGRYDGISSTAYLSTKFRFNPTAILEGGIYLNYFNSKDVFTKQKANYTSVFGYLKGSKKLSNKFSLGASFTTAIQPEHLLTTGDNGYPSDLWVPSTNQVSPERSYQTEIFGLFQNENYTVNASVFYKRQSNIVFYDTIPSLPSVTILYSDIWEGQTVRGDTEGYGFEFDFIYKWKENNALRIGYTFNETYNTFELVNNGDKFPFDYSIPHTLSLGLNLALTSKINFMADWYFSSGKPYTLYETSFLFTPLERDSDLGDVIQISDYNEKQLPFSHKLSLAFSSSWNFGKVRSDLYLGVQNIYNRKNILYKYNFYQEGEKSQSGFPILPMFRWRISI